MDNYVRNMAAHLTDLTCEAENERDHWLEVYAEAHESTAEDAMRGFLRLAADQQTRILALAYLRENYT